MSIDVQWADNTQTIISVTYKGKWTWEQFFAAANEATVMQNSVPQPVYMILDMRESVMPRGIVSKFRDIARIDQPNVRTRVLVLNTTIARKMYNLFANIYRPAAKQYRIAGSVEGAHELIEELQRHLATA